MERLGIQKQRKITKKRKREERMNGSLAAQDSPEETCRRLGEIRGCAMTVQTGRDQVPLTRWQR